MPALRGVGYSLDTAVADLIDNSIAAGASTVSIMPHISNGAASLAILDDGGGMTPDVMLDALRFGGSGPAAPRHARDLGRFGLGLKTASLSQARRLTVCSKALGEAHAMRWDLEHVFQGEGRWEVLEGFAGGSEHHGALLDSMSNGTLVLWEQVDFGRDRERVDESVFRSELRSLAGHLGMVFHRFIERGALQIRLGAIDVKAWDPFLETQRPTSTEVGADRIRTAAGDVLVSGFVMPHRDRFPNEAEFDRAGGPEGWYAHQGFHIYRGDRLVVSGGWLRLGHGKAWRRSETSRLARIRVEIPTTADFEWQIDVKKSVARPPASVRPRLERLAQDVRDRARDVHLHRARVSRSVPSKSQPLWLSSETPDGRRYDLNREHPAMVALRAANPVVAETAARLIESNVPVERIWLERSEDKIVPRGSSSMAIECAAELCRALIRTGSTRSEAVARVAAAEPFDAIDGIDGFLNAMLDRDDGGEDE
jgi:hypothetical protein